MREDKNKKQIYTPPVLSPSADGSKGTPTFLGIPYPPE